MSNNNANDGPAGMTPVEVADPVLVAEVALTIAEGKILAEDIVAHFRQAEADGEDLTMVGAQFAALLPQEHDSEGVAVLAVAAILMLVEAAELRLQKGADRLSPPWQQRGEQA